MSACGHTSYIINATQPPNNVSGHHNQLPQLQQVRQSVTLILHSSVSPTMRILNSLFAHNSDSSSLPGTGVLATMFPEHSQIVTSSLLYSCTRGPIPSSMLKDAHLWLVYFVSHYHPSNIHTHRVMTNIVWARRFLFRIVSPSNNLRAVRGRACMVVWRSWSHNSMLCLLSLCMSWTPNLSPKIGTQTEYTYFQPRWKQQVGIVRSEIVFQVRQ